MKTTRAVVVMVAWLLAISPADAGVIRGVIRTPAATGSGPSLDAYPGRAASLSEVSEVLRGLPVDAVISVATVPAAVESTLVASSRPVPELAQERQAFRPRVLAVARGSVVEFPNRDPIFHNVFSVSPVRRFDLGKYPRGHSRRVVFDKLGVAEVFCDIHANMAAFVVVLPNHAFTRPDAKGAFELPDLPPGAYVLDVWHPDLRGFRRKVQVPEHGDVEVELSL